MKPLYIVIPFFFSSFFCYSQFKIDAQYNLRFEARDGYKQLVRIDAAPSVFISQRSRISFSYETENLKLKFTPQDVRVWGDEQLASSTGVFGDNASITLFEGYAELKLSKLLNLKVGRQQLIYDREFILASRNWNQNGIAYDALLFKFKYNKWDVHLGGSWNSTADNISDNLYPPDRIKSLNFLWIKYKINDKITLTGSHFASGVTETDSTNALNFTQTSGLFGEYTSNHFTIKTTAFHQFGKSNNGNNVNASLVDSELTAPIQKMIPGIGISYLSGDKNSENNEENLFNVLYGARHRYFGHMDYYNNFTKNTATGGLLNIYANLKFEMSEKLKLTNTMHYFQLAQTNSLTPEDKYLGVENDLEFNYKFKDWGMLSGGYLFYLPSESLKTIQGVSNAEYQQFVYLQLTLTPNLLSFETK
jgi:hypothetical protein